MGKILGSKEHVALNYVWQQPFHQGHSLTRMGDQL
jgi:hypothetical protein